MAKLLRGDIRRANPNPTVGHELAGQRPVLILSQNVFNKNSGTVIAVAITSQPQKAGFPLTFELQNTKPPKKSWVKTSQIKTLSIKRTGKKIGSATKSEINMVIEGLNEILKG